MNTIHDENKIRDIWSNALDEETERRYNLQKHHPPEDCPLAFINEIKQYTEEMIAIAIPGQAWAEKIIGTSFETAMTENNKYIREKTIDDCIDCVPEQILEKESPFSSKLISFPNLENEGHNSCREKTITNLTNLKNNG